MIGGLRTACYAAPDLAAGKAWYTAVLGRPPYFDQPFYVGFSVGDSELGLVPDGTPSATGSLVYWSVDDIEKEFARLTAMGASVHEAITDVGGGVRVAGVHDPFGNVFGLIQAPPQAAIEPPP